jgi:hypothetical protein
MLHTAKQKEGIMLTKTDILWLIIERAKDPRKAECHVNGEKRCRYSAEVDGNKIPCFGGVLIPDYRRLPELEGKSIDQVWHLGAMPEVEEVDWPFVAALQNIHDTYDPECWMYEIGVVAASEGIATPIRPGFVDIPENQGEEL